MNNPYKKLLEERLRAFERKHAEYMQTSVFTDAGKRVKAEMRELENIYMITHTAWGLYEHWSSLLKDGCTNMAAMAERKLTVYVQKHKELLDNV